MFTRKIVLTLSATVLAFTLTACVEPPVDIPSDAPDMSTSTPAAPENITNNDNTVTPLTEADAAACATVTAAVTLFNSTENAANDSLLLNNLAQLNNTVTSTVFENPDLNQKLQNLKNSTTSYYSATLERSTSTIPDASSTATMNAQLQHQNASTKLTNDCTR